MFYKHHSSFIFCFTDFFRNNLGSEDEKKKNEIHSDHFPIELKSKEPSILIQLENGQNEFHF